MRKNERLKSRIIQMFGTQTEFATEMHLNFTMVSNVVNKHRKLSSEEKKRWAVALISTVDELF